MSDEQDEQGRYRDASNPAPEPGPDAQTVIASETLFDSALTDMALADINLASVPLDEGMTRAEHIAIAQVRATLAVARLLAAGWVENI